MTCKFALMDSFDVGHIQAEIAVWVLQMGMPINIRCQNSNKMWYHNVLYKTPIIIMLSIALYLAKSQLYGELNVWF